MVSSADTFARRVLMLHNRYLISGGEDVSTEAEARLLRSFGPEVDLYEVRNEDELRFPTWTIGLRAIWSASAFREVRSRVRAGRCTVVHVQNFFPLLSPSVYYAAKAERVPVVQTLRNYRLLCPNALFFRDGRVCEDCLGRPPWPGVVHACYRGSRAATAAVASMVGIHRLLGTWARMVDVYVALTEFARKKFLEGGLPAEKTLVKPNFVHPDPGVGEGRGGYALFVGRLSPEKGVGTLLDAWERLGVKVPLKIVGDGPLAQKVVEVAGKVPGVHWLGKKSPDEVYALMGEASFLVFSSEWYETFGRVAIEAYAKGTPVVASDIGAIAEVVEHGRTGLLVRPGDPDDLISKVEWLLAHPRELARMRREARAEYEQKYTAERNYKMLMDIYEIAMENHRKGR